MNYVLSDTKEQKTLLEALNEEKTLLEALYPIGAIYISLNPTSPASFLGGSWLALDGNQTLWATAWNTSTTKMLTTGSTGDTKSAGLPNITGHIDGYAYGPAREGAFKSSTISNDNSGDLYGSGMKWMNWYFKASDSNSIYSDSCSTVQPPAQCVYMWRRSA